MICVVETPCPVACLMLCLALAVCNRSALSCMVVNIVPSPPCLPAFSPQLTAPVQFEGSIKTLLERGLERSYEIGPNKVGRRDQGLAQAALALQGNLAACLRRPCLRTAYPLCNCHSSISCLHTGPVIACKYRTSKPDPTWDDT